MTRLSAGARFEEIDFFDEDNEVKIFLLRQGYHLMETDVVINIYKLKIIIR